MPAWLFLATNKLNKKYIASMEKGSNLYETDTKLKKFLRKLLEPKFELKNINHLNLLLKRWNDKTGTDAPTKKFKQKLNEIFCNWVIAATNTWKQENYAPSAAALSFTLKIGCQLSSVDSFFTKMENEGVYKELAVITKPHHEVNIDVSVGFINLLSSVLDNSSGVNWILKTSYWNDVFSTSLKVQNKYIKQKAYQFVIKLLEKTILLDADICEELVELLVEPLNKAAIEVQDSGRSEDENRNMHESLKPSLDLIAEVTEVMLKKMNRNVLNMFLESELPEAIQNILNFSQIQELSLDLLKIRFVFLFHHLCFKLEMVKQQQTTHDADTLSVIKVMFELIQAEVEKDHVRCVLKICYFAHVIYCNLKTKVPLCVRKGETIEFQNQMMLFQLVPVMTLGQQFLGTHKSKQLALTDDCRRDFYLKLAKISAIKTLEITYRWEQRLSNKSDLIEDVIISLKCIQKSKTIMVKEQAALMFQPLIYSLKDAIYHLEKHRDAHMSLSGIEYFTNIIDTIIDLVQSFDLTWKDSIETISILDLTCETLQHEYPDYQVTVKFLQLLNMAISRCMSPHMVLLMTNTNDAAILTVGNVLYSKCHSESYQIKNYALKVIRTVALDANTKFPEFTNILENAELPEIVVKMALRDKEPEVRATAVNCLRALILIESIWDVYQHKENFFCDLIDILVNEPHAEVRKETASIVSEIYKHYGFPENLLSRLYDIMTYSATVDINLDVKVNSMYFWGYSVQKYLEHEGMTDRDFPEYVFSQEKKKIVKITVEEGQRRRIKALYKMSEIGTLYAFKVALEDEELAKRCGKEIAKSMYLLYQKLSPDDKELNRPPQSNDFDSPQNSPDGKAPLDSQTSLEEDLILDSFSSPFPGSPFFRDLLDDFGDLSPHISDYAASSVTPDLEDTPNDTHNYNNGYGGNEVNFTEEELEQINSFNLEILNTDTDLELPTNIDSDSTDMTKAITMANNLFDKMLNLNDDNLYAVCNSVSQIKSPKIVTRQYVSPGEYLRSCIKVIEASEKEPIENLDKFDLLLNEILKENDLDLAA